MRIVPQLESKVTSVSQVSPETREVNPSEDPGAQVSGAGSAAKRWLIAARCCCVELRMAFGPRYHRSIDLVGAEGQALGAAVEDAK